WGNWEQFLLYANQVNSFVPEFLACAATALEVVLAVLLLVGYRIKWAAYGSAVLLALFAIAMTISFGIKSTLNYSVWIGAAGCLLLGAVKGHAYGIDSYLAKRKSNAGQ